MTLCTVHVVDLYVHRSTGSSWFIWFSVT